MASMAELKFYLTGGASNTDVTASIGGVVSSTQILSQSITETTSITGITAGTANGNSVGSGTLSYVASTGKLTWQPPNGSPGTGVTITSDGTYFIQGASNGGAVVVTVSAASLPTSNTTATWVIANQSNKIFNDVSKDESDVGTSIYRCIAVKNTGTDKKKDVTIWIAANTPGADTVLVGDAVAVAGNGTSTGLETAPANQTTAPSGVTFSSPSSKTSGIVLGELSGSAGATHTKCFWIKLLVPAGITEETLNNTFSIGYYAKV